MPQTPQRQNEERRCRKLSFSFHPLDPPSFLPSFALAEGEIRDATDDRRTLLVQQRIVDGDRIPSSFKEESYVAPHHNRGLAPQNRPLMNCATASPLREICLQRVISQSVCPAVRAQGEQRAANGFGPRFPCFRQTERKAESG